MGGKEKNKCANKKLKAGRGSVGKIAVAGIKDCEPGKVKVVVVEDTNAKTLQGFVITNTTKDTQAFTHDATAYICINRLHQSVKHSVGEYVRDQAHTNVIASF